MDPWCLSVCVFLLLLLVEVFFSLNLLVFDVVVPVLSDDASSSSNASKTTVFGVISSGCFLIVSNERVSKPKLFEYLVLNLLFVRLCL